MNNPSVRGNLLIGQGVIANGTIAAPGEAIIDGEMSGTIEAGKIIVGKREN